MRLGVGIGAPGQPPCHTQDRQENDQVPDPAEPREGNLAENVPATTICIRNSIGPDGKDRNEDHTKALRGDISPGFLIVIPVAVEASPNPVNVGQVWWRGDRLKIRKLLSKELIHVQSPGCWESLIVHESSEFVRADADSIGTCFPGIAIQARQSIKPEYSFEATRTGSDQE